MIRIAAENIASFNASIDDEGEEPYIKKFWDDLEDENPELMNSVLSNIETMEEDGVEGEVINSWLNGVFMCYSLIDRQIDSDSLMETCSV